MTTAARISCVISMLSCVLGLPERGIWTVTYDENHTIHGFPKSAFADTHISVSMKCRQNESVTFSVAWVLRMSSCANEYDGIEIMFDIQNFYLHRPYMHFVKDFSHSTVEYKQNFTAISCGGSEDHVHLQTPHQSLARTWNDGNFLFVMEVKQPKFTRKMDYSIEVLIKMHGSNGFLSAVDSPYQKICSFVNYDVVQRNGYSVIGVAVVASLLSTMGQTLSMVLYIVVSNGVGIIRRGFGKGYRPSLCVGISYFALASVVECGKVLGRSAAPGFVFFGAVLGLLYFGFLAMIVSNIRETYRLVKMTEDKGKFCLFKSFVILMVLSVTVSLFYTAWAMAIEVLKSCGTKLWFDEAYWKILLNIQILFIMYLLSPNAKSVIVSDLLPPLKGFPGRKDNSEVVNEAFDFSDKSESIIFRMPTKINASSTQL